MTTVKFRSYLYAGQSLFKKFKFVNKSCPFRRQISPAFEITRVILKYIGELYIARITGIVIKVADVWASLYTCAVTYNSVL